MNINEILDKKGILDSTLLLIDKYNLDAECQRHSELYRIIGDLCAEYESLKDEAKDNLTAIEGDLCEQQRRSFMQNNGEKLSDTRALHIVKSLPEYKDAFKTYSLLRETYLKLENRKQALLQRSYMISNLCNLYNGNYFSNLVIKDKTNEVTKEHSNLRTRIRKQES